MKQIFLNCRTREWMKYFIAFFLIIFLPMCVSAQETTSGITGKIVAGGEEAIGATVKAVHEASGTTYVGVTNAHGRFSIEGMRPGGPYKVEISYIGFKTRVITGVMLKLGDLNDLSGSMDEDSEMLRDVVVTGKRGLNASKTGAAESYPLDFINDMPSISHSITDVVKQNPLLHVSPDGAMSFAGTNNRYNQFLIDGASNNDVFGLSHSGFNGGQSGSQPVSLETIEQIQINVAPFDVRLSGFTGGSINAISKSGSNEFHGSVYGFGNNKNLIGRRYELAGGGTSEKYDDQREYLLGLTLGGPIVKNRLFFFANFEHTSKEYSNMYGIGSDASTVDASKALEALEYVRQLAQRQGVNFTDDFNNPDVYTKSTKGGLKLDWNINDRHKASVRWQIVDSKQLTYVSNASGLAGSNYMFDFKSLTNNVAFELQSNFSSSLRNEFRVTYTAVRDERVPGNPEPMIVVNGIGNGSVYLGNDRSSMANSISQNVWRITDNFTWYKGNHSMTFGTNNEFYSFGNLFIQDIYGSYYFNSLDDLRNGNISRYRYGQANVEVTGDPKWKAEFGAGQLGFYAQDRWSVANDFELTYGLRMDIPMFFDTPSENAGFNLFAATRGWGIVTNHKMKRTPLWSPRVGFRWNITGDRRYILRGGVGVFTGRIPFVWLLNNFSNTGIQLQSYDQRNPSTLNLILDPNGQQPNVASLAASGSQTLNVFDDDFRFTQSAKVALGLDATLWGIDWTFDGVFTKTINDISYENLAVEPTGHTLGEVSAELPWETRLMMGRVTGGTPYSAIYKLSNTGKGYSYSLSLKAEKHFDFGLDVMASYTFTKSKSVNSGLATVAATSYQYNVTAGNPNDAMLHYSAFNLPHAINATVFYRKEYGSRKQWKTTVGLIYKGTSGQPYTLYYNGDVNGDGVYNDLMYIPTDAQIDQMTFKATTDYSSDVQKANLKAWLAADDYLSKHRGEYYDRFADNGKFEHHFDLHLAQRYQFRVGKMTHAVELSIDMLNISNLLNKKWGHYTSSNGYGNFYAPLNASYSNGTTTYQFLHTPDYKMYAYDDYLSRWRGQIGLKYTF